MEKSKITTLLSIIVTLGGAIVMIGWIMDIEILKSILPIWVTMKFTTAFSFFLSGIILYFVTNTSIQINSDIAQIVLSFAILIILLLMGTFLFSSFLNIRTGIEDYFMIENENSIQTSTSGRPSLGSMVNFILVAIIGLMTMNDAKDIYKKTIIISSIITVIGVIAIFGYIFSIPYLYYLIEGLSTGMAIHTAILFIIIGISFLIHEKNNKTNKTEIES